MRDVSFLCQNNSVGDGNGDGENELMEKPCEKNKNMYIEGAQGHCHLCAVRLVRSRHERHGQTPVS